MSDFEGAPTSAADSSASDISALNLVHHIIIEFLRALSLSETLDLTLADLYENVIFGDGWVVARSSERPFIITRGLLDRTKDMVADRPMEQSAFARQDERIFLDQRGEPITPWSVQKALCQALDGINEEQCPLPGGTFRHFDTDGLPGQASSPGLAQAVPRTEDAL